MSYFHQLKNEINKSKIIVRYALYFTLKMEIMTTNVRMHLIVKKSHIKMKNIILVILIANLLSACALAPKLKQPNDRNRVPINKTIPAEIKRGDR